VVAVLEPLEPLDAVRKDAAELFRFRRERLRRNDDRPQDIATLLALVVRAVPAQALGRALGQLRSSVVKVERALRHRRQSNWSLLLGQARSSRHLKRRRQRCGHALEQLELAETARGPFKVVPSLPCLGELRCRLMQRVRDVALAPTVERREVPRDQTRVGVHREAARWRLLVLASGVAKGQRPGGIAADHPSRVADPQRLTGAIGGVMPAQSEPEKVDIRACQVRERNVEDMLDPLVDDERYRTRLAAVAGEWEALDSESRVRANARRQGLNGVRSEVDLAPAKAGWMSDAAESSFEPMAHQVEDCGLSSREGNHASR
jgi:hypothetical protein